ncbi:MAG: PrpR N-terminal domain-containing protein [Clostridia bacterium]|nr:PrpR N-terminal domain-containing protein [Clostridia bacterium]
MRQIRLLAIMPNEGLAKVLSDVCKTRNDLSVTIKIGNLSAGLALCKAVDSSTYDLILSRGGTARLLAQHMSKPVVEIRATIYDLLRVIRLVGSHGSGVALVGYPNMTSCINEIADMLRTTIKVVTITSEEMVHDTILKLRQDGYTVVIGDTIAVSEAKSQQMNGILIPSGIESITAALDEAVSMFSTLEKKTQQAKLLKHVLAQQGVEYLLFDNQNKPVFSECSPSVLGCVCDLSDLCPSAPSTPDSTSIKRLSGRTYLVAVSAHEYMGSPCTLVSLREKKGVWNDSALAYSYKQPGEMPYYDHTGCMQSLEKTLSSAAPLKNSILLLAEEGTDLSMLLNVLHANSLYSKEPFVRIDFRYLRESAFQSLLHKENSPFSENHHVLFLDNVDFLSDSQQKQLIECIASSLLFKRNKGIVRISPANRECPLYSYLVNEQSLICCRVPPLRERKADIPTIATQLTSLFNYDYTKQIVGFDDSALELMTQFDWPENSAQLYRVIQKLVSCTEGSKITCEAVKSILCEENAAASCISLSALGTLDEITYSVVCSVLKEENMNKTKAAERLGIGRTTLWRILQRDHKQKA